MIPSITSARRHDKAKRPTRALVTNAVPFNLKEGLPRELGPLLFDPVADASVLAGGRLFLSPTRDGGPREKEEPQHQHQHRQQQPHEDHPQDHNDRLNSRAGGTWTRRRDLTLAHGNAEIFARTVEVAVAGDACHTNAIDDPNHQENCGDRDRNDGREPNASTGTTTTMARTVEIRFRASPLDAEALAMSGLPIDARQLQVELSASYDGGGNDGDVKAMAVAEDARRENKHSTHVLDKRRGKTSKVLAR